MISRDRQTWYAASAVLTGIGLAALAFVHAPVAEPQPVATPEPVIEHWLVDPELRCSTQGPSLTVLEEGESDWRDARVRAIEEARSLFLLPECPDDSAPLAEPVRVRVPLNQRRGLVEIGQPSTDAIDRVAIRRAINHAAGAIAACYESALRTRPTTEGDVTVQFFILPTGKVKRPVAAGFDLGVARCVAEVIGRLELPARADGVQVLYPFSFRPA